jgi:UDP-GlcNAc:undecaprenyl-phosphate/decaprenyl-phosphate GlcNAc-1-phosphate transferase
MALLIFSFFLNLTTTLALVRSKHLHEKLTGDNLFSGPQKFHSHSVPRIGGVGIYVSLLLTGVLTYYINNLDKGLLILKLLECATPTFLIGLAEDISKKIGVTIRLIVTALSAILGIYSLNVVITHTQVPGIDVLLSIEIISIIFTVIAITGLANAYNIIDGFNGLASMVGIISLLAIGYVAFKTNDPTLTSVCLIVIGTIAGFFIWNYPRGLIFLGDGGAYLIGYLTATLSILLVIRNPSVSPWFSLLVNAYPIFETLFTIWRRKVHQGKNPGLPDGAHFHSLIYRRVIRWAEVNNQSQRSTNTKNAKTSPYLWFLSSLAVCPAIIWWQSTWILQGFTILFCVSYLWAYNKVVKFKTSTLFKLFK